MNIARTSWYRKIDNAIDMTTRYREINSICFTMTSSNQYREVISFIHSFIHSFSSSNILCSTFLFILAVYLKFALHKNTLECIYISNTNIAFIKDARSDCFRFFFSTFRDFVIRRKLIFFPLALVNFTTENVPFGRY